MPTRVFVCSTVFDLVDLRAELEAELKAMGLTPVMSDRASADFDVPPDRNSIEACLVNVESCDFVIVVLSRRYGPSLERAGYGDLSASNVEYNRARELGKPIYLYARDRLEADYRFWKENHDTPVKLSWVSEEKDRKILELLHEHRDLVERKEGSNWFWTFRDSVELKQRIRKDLAAPAGEATLQRLIDGGRMPFFTVLTTGQSAGGPTRFRMEVGLINHSSVPAFGLEMSALGHQVKTARVGDFSPEGRRKLDLRCMSAPSILRSLSLTYTVLEGLVIRDDFTRADDVSGAGKPGAPLPQWRLSAKVLVGSGSYELRVEQKPEASGSSQ